MNLPKRFRYQLLLLIPILAIVLTLGYWHGRQHQTQEILGLPAVRKGEAPINTETPTVRFPQPRIHVLPNGLRVFVIEDHRLPYAQCSLALPAGTLVEPKPGLADLTASMMMEGTERRAAVQLAAAFEQSGMSFGVQAEPETTTMHCGGSAGDFPQMLALMREVLLHPSFSRERLLRLQSLKAADWDRTHSNASYINQQVSGRLFYGDTPYRQEAARLEQVEGLNRDDLLSFYAHCYRPNGAVLGVIGDVRASSVLKQLGTAFDAWKEAPGPLDLPPTGGFPPPSSAHGLHLVNWRNATDTTLVFEARTVARSDPDYVPLVVANRVLGGVSSARLFQNLRETQGYTYGIYSTLTASPWPGIWSAWVTIPYAHTASAVRGVFGELQTMEVVPVPMEELGRAKRGLIGSLAISLEKPGDVLDNELDLIRNNLPADYWQIYSAKIQAVTPEDVQRVARRYLGNSVQVIVIGPHDKIADDLHSFGPFDERDHRGVPIH